VNTYVDLQMLKGAGGLNVTTGTLLDDDLLGLGEDISRQIDRWANRFFYYVVRTRTFDGNGKNELLIPDIISVDSIREDSTMDGTYDTTWATDDYILYPTGSDPTSTSGEARPYNRIQVSLKSNGNEDEFVKNQDNYQIVGTWGFQKIFLDSGLDCTLVDSTTTSMVLTGSATGTVEPGHTALIDDELVYVKSTTGTSATVVRAVNGSTGTAHLAKDVSIIQYPGPIVRATFLQVNHIFHRKDAPSPDPLGVPGFGGGMRVMHTGLDEDVRALMNGYKRPGL